MSLDGVLSGITLITGAVALLLALIPSFADVRTKSEDGRVRFTVAGRIVLALAGAAFILTSIADQVKDHKQGKEKAAAEAEAQARTDSITRRLEGVLSETRVLRDESERLRDLQRLGLQQVDSVSRAAAALSNQQQRAIADLGLSLTLSRRISDSLQASVALSRQITDSLRLAEARADERTRQMLASVARRSNPLTSLNATFRLSFVRRDSLSARVLDALWARSTVEHRLLPTYPHNAPLRAGGEAFSEVLPTVVFLYLWRNEDCENSFDYNQVFVSAARRLNYDSATIDFERNDDTGAVQRLHLSWDEAPFAIRTLENITVDDLGGACLLVELGPRFMSSPRLSVGWWDKADVFVSAIGLPQGRFWNLHRRAHSLGRETRYMRIWENTPPTLPTQLEWP